MKHLVMALWVQAETNGRKVFDVCDPIYNDYSEGYVSSKSNLTTTCTGSKYHTCSTLGNYGSISVDFDKQIVSLALRTPKENEGAEVKISYSGCESVYFSVQFYMVLLLVIYML